MEKKFVSGVIYLHNNENRIVDFLEKIIPIFQNEFTHYEMVFVDDYCIDRTIDILKEWCSENKILGAISIVRMGLYQGVEVAMNAGRDASIGDFVFEFDKVLVDYDYSLVMELYNKSQEGYDIVAASAKGSGDGFSKLFYNIFNHNTRDKIALQSESFRIISRRAINRIKSMSSYIPYRKMLYSTCGLKHTCIEYFSNVSKKVIREYKRSNASVWERSNLAFKTFAFYTNIMEKISFILAMFFLLFSLGMIIYSIADRFVSDNLADGWASIICIMSFGFFGVFALITIVLRYLSIIIDLNFTKQRMVVEDIEKIC